MARRMYYDGKFEDPWYRKLSPQHKSTYEYILCKCDYAGVLDIDIDDLNYKVKNEIKFEDIKQIFQAKLIILDEQVSDDLISRLKIFIPRFIFWQYKNELAPSNPVHRCVYGIFQQEGISIEPYLAPFVLKEDFENWCDLLKEMKEEGISYKDVLKKRKQ